MFPSHDRVEGKIEKDDISYEWQERNEKAMSVMK